MIDATRRDILEIGPVPASEACEQLGPGYDIDRARRECRQFIAQLRRQFGPEPEGARLVTRSRPHDFGDYIEVVVEFDPGDIAAVDYAYRVEADAEDEWDEQALVALLGGELTAGVQHYLLVEEATWLAEREAWLERATARQRAARYAEIMGEQAPEIMTLKAAAEAIAIKDGSTMVEAVLAMAQLIESDKLPMAIEGAAGEIYELPVAAIRYRQ